jgi:hypothetical protein
MSRHCTRSRVLRIGTISEGTLRTEDLLAAYLWDLSSLRLSREDRHTLRAIQARVNAADDDAEYWQEDASDDLDALQAMAESYTPDYAYHGTLAGDGAHFGVWPDIDSVRDDGNAIGALPPPGDYGRKYYLQVTDHGNATLYRRLGTRRWREVWSVV